MSEEINLEQEIKAFEEKEKKKVKKKLFKAFFVDKKRQEKVRNQITENAKGDFDFYLMTIFSAIIIALGIIIDSSAVVIGGMLIAPLVWPILALSLGITAGRSHLLRTSLGTIVKATLLILIISFLLGLIVPDLVTSSNEFLSRTSPTLFELLIGLAAGFIGAFIIAYPKMGSAIAGVVVAAAVVPPIATIGLSLAGGDFSSVAGALLLFVSNLIAITFAATILFIISDFGSKDSRAKEKSKVSFRWTLLILVVIVIPLIIITKQTTLEAKQLNVVQDVVESSLENAHLSEVKIQEKDNIVTVELTVRSQENLADEQVKAMENIISKRLNDVVILKAIVIPVIEPGADIFSRFIGKDKVAEVVKENLPAEPAKGFLSCPVELNGRKVTRDYPVSIGCPICPKVIVCEDGREFTAHHYDEASGLCSDLIFVGGSPCVGEEERQ